jgi:hypothetical protein
MASRLLFIYREVQGSFETFEARTDLEAQILFLRGGHSHLFHYLLLPLIPAIHTDMFGCLCVMLLKRFFLPSLQQQVLVAVVGR